MKKTRIRGITLLKKGQTPYPDSPDKAKLETFENITKRDYTVRFESSEFTSMCPITGQPDFARIEIEYMPGRRCIESKSLKLYLFSFRNTGMFAEDIANRILDDIDKSAKPKRAKVIARFTARGGIGITVEAEKNSKEKNASTK